MAPPLPQATPQQQAEAMQAMALFASSFTSIAEVIHLSVGKSVNLRHVAAYESVPVENDDDGSTEAAGKSAKKKPEPEYAPAIRFAGSDEWNILEPAEDAIFRPAWQRHAMITGWLYGMLDSMFQQYATAAPGGEVPGGQE